MTRHLFSFRSRGPGLSRRGMALLLVMIGLVVCTILTAGFLATQGTSIGIARNERDAAKTHAIAQSGIDMCYWLIRNKADWRQTMPVGDWLTNNPVGDGAVTVSVDDDNHNLADDPTQPVTVSATGSFGDRAFTLTATVRPTGGGTVFKDGNFVTGGIALGNDDLLRVCVLDSYNSSVANYNPLLPGTNASFGSNSTDSGGLKNYFPSLFRGTYAAAPSAVTGNVIQLFGGATGPAAVNRAVEVRSSGEVIFPNTAGFNDYGAISSASSLSPQNVKNSGSYEEFKANGGVINIISSGTFHLKNDLTINTSALAALNVQNNVTANIVVHGNVNIGPGKIAFQGSNSRLNLFVEGNVTLSNGGAVSSSASGTSRVVIYGGSRNGAIQINDSNSAFYGSIYAPHHSFLMQNNSPKFFGAVLAKSLVIKDNAAFHFDEALRSLRISNITGGSAPAGLPDYTVTLNTGPGIIR